MTMSFYVARRFFRAFLMVLGGFAAILFMVETLEQVRRVSGTDLGMRQATMLAALNLPGSLFHILPLITILATVALFLGLARTSELVVMRAAGRSGLRMLVAPVLAAMALGALAVAVIDPIVASTTKRSEELAAQYQLTESSAVLVGSDGLWLRQGAGEGQIVIHARTSNPEGTLLSNVTFMSFLDGSRPETRYEAAEARLTPGAWVLKDVKVWNLAGEGNAEAEAETHPTLDIASDLTADQIRNSFDTPNVIAIWDLPQFIIELRRAGFSARAHRVWFQIELALPLLMGAMVLVGAGLTMRHARFSQTGLLALMTIVFGFTIFFIRNFAQVMGENGQIPVALAAWSPPVAAILLAVSLVLHLEDG
ncbi:MAG: hypothetical protein RLZZ528_77 [Pseudomonadota bacterium]